MRRGHAGIGGWRNENPRHFRPRTGGPPQYRHPLRNFPLLEGPRFPPPGQRLPRGPPPFHNHPNLLNNHSTPENHDRNKYRQDHRQSSQYRPSDRSHHQSQRSIFPLLDRLRQKDTPEQSCYYDNPREPSHINSMGDVDHRQQGKVSKTSDHYSRHQISPWSNPQELQRQFYDERNKYNKHYKHHDTVDSSKISTLDYAGHRPPASDHYGGNPNSSIDNSHSFSRSVDDTVDIVRKRLQNRSEPQPPGEPMEQLDEDLRIPRSTSGNYINIPQEQPPKKRVQRQKQDRNEFNCNKMKSKIVQQLFKMDKDRIHKLMDNPSSSSKFEYAISSLITESQNSLNKHLRSLAEKSLSSSDEFIHNDNNTIYEDTFMKQMQNILDPQDTVLLEDIKPLVLAELSKVLQINEYDQPFQVVDDKQNYPQTYDQPTCDSYSSSEIHNYEDYSHSHHSYYDQINAQPVGYEDYGNSNADLSLLGYDQHQPVKEEPHPLFERRKSRKSIDCQPEPCFSPVEQPNSNSGDVNTSGEEFPLFPSDKRLSRRSLDKQNEDKIKEAETVPVFDPNSAQFSEEDDPFAELDNQYHVAVDRNFIGIETFGTSSSQSTSANNSRSSSKNRESNNKTPSKDYVSVKQEIESQLHDFAKSPIKLLSMFNSSKTETPHKSINNSGSIKKEIITPTKDNANNENHAFNIGVKQECNTDSRNVDDHSEKSLEMTPTLPKTALTSSSRKRSSDQKPSHRKEKRKKSETSQSDSNQQILNKNIIINVNDCAAKDSEKCADSTKSIFNLFFSKNGNSKDVPKDTKKVESVEKSYSDKYVKRKESRSKSKDKGDEHKKRHSSLSTSHSIVSSKDSTNNNTSNSKFDSKTKLQNIDIFSEQPKKVSTKHQAHRNTALSPNTPTKPTDITKTKQTQITFNKKVTKRHVATQIFHKTNSRPTQTEKNKSLEKLVQTDPVSFGKTKSKATDAFERMKEIDMEIQELLQEKFKLYSSLESNPQCPSTIHTLGMTVLNMPLNEVTENDDNSLSVDTIVDDFTNIPVEELEQIAMDTVNTAQTPQVEKKSRRHKISEESRASSASPTVKRSARMAAKTPNISLLEQIITDDRPLEDIISLDDLETTPVKTRKKSVKHPKSKKKKTVKIDKTVPVLPSIAALPSITDYNLKECCVVLKREDLSKYTKPKVHTQEEKEPIVIKLNLGSDDPASDNVVPLQVTPTKPNVQFLNDSDIVEETVVENDIQFDMLDVSEDIVIGDVCEIKSGDKEAERTELAVAEEIILDNSQSSMEPVQTEGGPADNICKMYDYSTDENLRRDAVTVSGHADAVLALESIENNFVAACLDGNVYYFSADGQLLATLRGSNLAVTCLTIVKEKYGTTVYTGSLDSRIRYYDLETGLEKGPECNVLSPIQTMDRAWDTIFVGTRTGFVLQFECKNNLLIPVSTVKFSDQSILALRAMKEGPRKVLLVAARSEDVTIKDAQSGLLLRTLQGPKMTVYTLLFEDGKVYCGTSSHQIHVFDYASGGHVGAHEGGKGAVCLRASGGLLFAGCYDGCVYVYREGESQPLAQLRGPSLMLLSLAVVGSKIIAGYKDRSLYIWKIPLSILQEMIL